MSHPAGRTLRLPNVCPGQRAEWVPTSSPRMAPCPPSPPAPTTKSPITTATTSTCSSTPSAPLQTRPPSSLPRVAQLATGRPTTPLTRTTTTTEPPPPPPTTTATTTAACLADSPALLRPAPAAALSLDQSATPSCPTPRCCRRPTASRRLPPRRRLCPPPQSRLPTLPAWGGSLSWCLRRTRQVLWCESKQNTFIALRTFRLGLMKTVLPTHTHTHTHTHTCSLTWSTFYFVTQFRIF